MIYGRAPNDGTSVVYSVMVQSNFSHVNYRVAENRPTPANCSPSPDISPKSVGRLFFVIPWPVKINFSLNYISLNTLVLTCSNIEFQKCSRGDNPGPTLQLDRGRGRKREIEGGKRQKRGERRVKR